MSHKAFYLLRVFLGICLVVTIGFSVGSAYAGEQELPSSTSLGCGGGQSGSRVQPILFVPSNLTADPSYLSAIDSSLVTITNWYASQLGGRTFNCNPAVQVIGSYDLKHYCPSTTADTQCVQIPGELGANPSDIYSVLSDLESQGYAVQQDTIILVFWVGGYGYAAGAQVTDRSGWAALGDWALDGIAGKYEAGTSTSNCSDSSFAWLICTEDAQVGSVAHELGHAFGLPHPTDDGTQTGDPNYWLSTVMAVSWDFPDVVLIDSEVNPERTTLVRHPFFWIFYDVSPSYWAHNWVEAIHNSGLSTGYPDGTYRPTNPVNRAEMAVFLKKGIHGATYTPPAPDGSHPFSDIAGHWAEAWMEDLYDEGMTSGYPDGTYRPANNVSRAEMAVFLLKAKHGETYTPPTPDGGSFSDVGGHWAEAWIEQLAEEGITSGYPDGTFRPGNNVTRAEMAVFLVNAFGLALP